MNETTIMRQIMKNWQRQQPGLLWWYKIPDYMPFQHNTPNARAVDIIACYNGICVGMEWKIKKDDRAFPINRVRMEQIKTLCDIEVAGGVGFLAIAVYKGPHDKCVYIIPISRWNSEVAFIKNEQKINNTLIKPRKSIRIEEVFDDYRIKPIRVGSFVHWNMKQIEKIVDAKKTE